MLEKLTLTCLNSLQLWCYWCKNGRVCSWSKMFLKRRNDARIISLPNWIGALTLSLLLRLISREWDPWFMKFLPPMAALYLFYATIWPCTEYCCHIRAAILDEQQKQVCRTVGPFFTSNLELSAHHQNAISWILFYSYYFGRCSFKLVKLILNPPSPGTSILVVCSRCYKVIYFNSCFPCAARLRNSLPAECSPLTYDLNDLNFRVNRHIFPWVFSKQLSYFNS